MQKILSGGYALRWTIPGPDSSYSCLETHRFWKVESEAKMEPPIQTEYLRSGGATIFICVHIDQSIGISLMENNEGVRTFMLAGERDVSSLCIRSAIPGNMVVPPERTTFP